jgi:hypothetical protein
MSAIFWKAARKPPFTTTLAGGSLRNLVVRAAQGSFAILLVRPNRGAEDWEIWWRGARGNKSQNQNTSTQK